MKVRLPSKDTYKTLTHPSEQILFKDKKSKFFGAFLVYLFVPESTHQFLIALATLVPKQSLKQNVMLFSFGIFVKTDIQFNPIIFIIIADTHIMVIFKT